MNHRLCFTLFVIATGILIAPTGDKAVEQGPPAYAGAQKCKLCHYAVYECWAKTPHAHTFSSILEGEKPDSACVRCHTTGYRKGGYGSLGLTVNLQNVQCEACHGAGSMYSRSSVMRNPEVARRLGLVKPDSLGCVKCHNEGSPTFKGFNFEKALRTGTHTCE